MSSASISEGDPGHVPPLPQEAYVRMTLVLRLGLGLSLAILGGGIVAYLLMNPGQSSSSVLANNPILSYLTLPGLASGLGSGSVSAVLTLGLIVLVATPIVRVVSGLYYFQKVGERAMTAITLAVLILLLLGLLVIGPHVR
ncbi:MAG TPA: DUF1634 domain-containing protein [Thermoplasmata archaeon]|nr:DUF1634 domain-containing protein [Thermoplasmata archaeon]